MNTQLDLIYRHVEIKAAVEKELQDVRELPSQLLKNRGRRVRSVREEEAF